MNGFIDQDLCNDVERVIDDGVIKEVTANKDFEKRHLSELNRIVASLDEVEVYTVTKALVKYHRETFVKTLEDMEKEGETEDEQ